MRGPQPPYVGAVMIAVKGRSGRRWEITGPAERGDDLWHLRPMGEDVQDARSDETGKWQGGVRGITRSGAELRDRKRWRQYGTTARALP